MLAMANVTPDLFRRKMTWRVMQSVEKQIEAFTRAGVHDNNGAVVAGVNELAARMAVLAGRPDLASEFERKRDRAIEDAKSTPPMRRRTRKKKP
jgi:hypothetical protein